MTLHRPLLAAALLLPLLGCNVWEDRAEFGPPQSRWPSTLPSASLANAPPPPIGLEYCYRTLAGVDCFNEAKPERVTGYTGVYPAPVAAAPPR
jgi:hypothetical protein